MQSRTMNDSMITHAFEEMRIPLMILGPEGAILRCNRAAGHLFGHSVDGLTKLSIHEVLPDASVTALDAAIERPNVDAVIRDMAARDGTGRPIFLTVQVTILTEPDRGNLYALALRNTTKETDRRQRAVRERERAENAIRGARIGVFEFDPGDGSVAVSDIWRDLLEMPDTAPEDVQDAWRARVHPADLDTALDPVRRCLSGEAARATCEYRLRARDGTRWRWMQTDVAAVGSIDDGHPTRLIGATSEITDRKDAESRLRRMTDRLRSSFENPIVGQAILRLDGTFEQVNAALCDLIGHDMDVMLAIGMGHVTHPDDHAADRDRLARLIEGEVPAFQIEKRYVRANGAVMWGLCNIALVRDADGTPEHFVSQIVDITERRRLAELKSEFVATVSHELRTPLTSVLGSLTLLSLMDEEPFSDEARRLLYIAEENGKRLGALIEDILDFEKFSARQMRFSSSDQNVADMMGEAALANRAVADIYGVGFAVAPGDRSLSCRVDPGRFQQVMTNLLSNAAKFATPASDISVAAERRDDMVRVSVANAGEPIPEAFRDMIFRPFLQALPVSTRNRGGTGLGLSITRQIVEQMGGAIGFDSTPEGTTVFWFTVPAI